MQMQQQHAEAAADVAADATTTTRISVGIIANKGCIVL
jgi:hypothetical protein